MKRASQIALGVLLVLALGGTAMAQSATVMTDQADYAPGTIVTITGSGWQPGETVTLSFVESPLLDTHPDLTAVADANGDIFNNQFSPDSHDVNITFTLTATGQTSGLQAQTTFTDNTNFTVSVGPQSPASITPGNSATYTVTVSGNGNGGCTVSLSASGLPTGASAQFSPSSLSVNIQQNPTSTLTISTTASTPAGTTTFTVTGAGTGSQCNTTSTSGTGTLTIIAGPASKLAFTNSPVTVTAGACSSALTIQSRDANGNPSNVTSTETLSPSGSPAGASFFTNNTCTTAVTGSNLTIASGSNTATFFFKDTTTGSVTITVTGTGAFTANGANAATQTETVNAATARRGQTIIATLFPKDRYTLMALE